MKKVLMITIMLAMMLPTMGQKSNVQVNSIYYQLDNKLHTAEVVAKPRKYGCYSGEIVIPLTIKEKDKVYTVNKIAHKAFANAYLYSLELPMSIAFIDNTAFENCDIKTLFILNSTARYGNIFLHSYVRDKLVIDGSKLYPQGEETEEVVKTLRQRKMPITKTNVYLYYGLHCLKKNQHDPKAFYFIYREAKSGNTEAKRHLAQCYHTGRGGINKNDGKALEIYEELAKNGDIEALYQLGSFHEYGWGCSKDLRVAHNWYRQASNAGSGKATYVLAKHYFNGVGVEKNLMKAFDYLDKARFDQNAKDWIKKIETDNIQNFPSLSKACQGDAAAQYNVAMVYLSGEKQLRDTARAVYWLRKAALQNNSNAQLRLGELFFYGEGVCQNYAQAADLYRKSAEQGNARAQCNLGYCYSHGKGVEHDDKQAVYWFNKSAEKENAIAQNNLGWCYEFGVGVEKNYAMAKKWYQQSAEKGNSKAKANLKKIESKLLAMQPQSTTSKNSNHSTENSSHRNHQHNNTNYSSTSSPNGDVYTTMSTPCYMCGQTGICPHCHGAGQIVQYYGGVIPPQVFPCVFCNMTGKCYHCNGLGHITNTVVGNTNTGNWVGSSSNGYVGSGNIYSSQEGSSSSSSSSTTKSSSSSSSSSSKPYVEVIVYAPKYTSNIPKEWCEKCQRWDYPHAHVKKYH